MKHLRHLFLTALALLTAPHTVGAQAPGTADTGFAPTFFGDRRVRHLKTSPAGVLATITGDEDVYRRFDASGALDASFAGQANDHPIVIQPDGKVIARRYVPFRTGFSVIRTDANGALDPTFAGVSESGGKAVDGIPAPGIYLPNGQVVVGNGYRLVWLNSDGTVAQTFNTGTVFPGGLGFGTVSALARQADGRVLAAMQGRLLFQEDTTYMLVRFEANGTRDMTFGTDGSVTASGCIHDIICQPDGKILIAGQFNNIAPFNERKGLARLDSNGALDQSFNPGFGSIKTILYESDDSYRIYPQHFDEGRARLDPDGHAVKEHYEPDPYVLRMALQADGRIIVFGQFTSVTFNERKNMARINPDGTVDSLIASIDHAAGAGYHPGYDQYRCIYIYDDWLQLNHIKKWEDGPYWKWFDAGLAIQDDGKILVGGEFGHVGFHGRPVLARLHNDPAINSIEFVGQTKVQWTLGGSAPDLLGVTFERSSDGGTTWMQLGQGSRVGTSSNWELGGLNLSTGRLRARGLTHRGGLVEKTVDYNLGPPPVASNPVATNIGTNSATLGGTVTEGLAGSVTGRGVVLSITSFNADPVIGGNYVEQISTSGTTGAFTVQATSLGTPVNYSFRAYATYEGGVAYSPVATFSTLGNSPPTVTTPTAANIAATTATLGGNVTSAGTQPVTERGVCYALTSVNASPQPNHGNVTKVTTSGTTGAFTVNATGLLANSQYSYRAYALSAEGWGWSSVGTFTTPVTAPTLTTVGAVGHHARGATLVGRVNPNGFTVTPLFFFGKTPDQMSYQQATPSSVSGSSPVEVSYDFNFAEVHTTYYYAVGYIIQGFPPVMASDAKTFTTVDTLPVASNTEIYVAEDGPYSVLLPAKDDDGDSLTASIDIPPAHGTVSGGSYAPGYGVYVLYTPAPNFHGSDSFVFRARDPQGNSGTGTVTISVASINDPPTLNAIPNPAALLEDAGMQTVSLSGISTGAPNETQTLTVTASSSNTALIPHPTVSYTSPNATGTLTFTPVANARGLAVITVTVNDGETTTDRTFLVTVNQVNKEPTFALPSSGLPAGETWTAQASGNRNWWAITSSADGTKLAAVVYGGSIYTSTDAGVTWVERPGTYGLWSAITSSADGRKLSAALNNGYVHTSTDAGLTWTAQSSSGQRKWTGIASSADGTKLAAVANGNFSENAEYIYTSTDSGVTWTRQESAYGQWTGIASSSDGTKLAAARGSVYTSTNSGATWTPRSADGRTIASSADGTKLIAAGADVYTSVNSGVNWTWRLDGNRNWRSVASSADGTMLAAVTGSDGQIYTSANAGLTWTTQPAGDREWMSIASSADGSRLAAVVLNGQIYTSAAPLYNMTVSSGAGAMSIPSFATAISVGPPEETGQTVSFQVTNDNNALFSVQPAIAPNGTLTFTPNPTAPPTKVTVSVTARDDGGTANGGVDTSFTHSFTITLGLGSVTHTYANASDVPLTSSAPVIAGGSTATLALGHVPVAGTELVVIKNTGPAFISGAFTNLAHGQTVSLSYAGEDYEFVANYYGGTGNDLVLAWKNTRVMAWGRNDHGQLGNNSTTQSLVPAATLTSGVLSGKTVLAVSAGYQHSLALCSDGTVAAWGNNDYGQLGNNSTTQSAVPVAVNTNGVLSGKTVVAVAAGAYHSVALCSDGTVATWGDNRGGALGNSTTTDSSVPVAVIGGGVLSGKAVTAISAGYYHSLVLCSDGTVAAWGDNRNGQLGNNSTTNSNVPVAVNTSGVLAGKTAVAASGSYYHSLALCSDGTVAAWGDNEYGQLGNNNTTRSLVPVAVNTSGVLSGKLVVAVDAGDVHNVALCSDGTVAGWGNNGNGQLGNNSKTNSSVPVAVDTGGVLAGKTVVAFTVGGYHTVVRCSDGTVAAWGFNYYGQLGNNTTTQSLVPVDARDLVGSSTLGGGSYHNLALAPVPTVNAPTVTADAASGLAGTIATLNGTVNANGGSTTVTFQYGATASYGQTAAAQPAPVTGNSPVGVSAALSGLQPRTLYHFRLSATNAAGTVDSADATFTTPNSTPLAFGHGGLNTAEDSPMDILLGGLDADGDTLTFAVASQPAHGTVSITGSTATYTPAADFSGSDSFTFTARDAFTGVSEPALVSLVITPVNDPPTLAALSPLSVNEDAGWQTVDLTGISTGAANEAQSLSINVASSNPALVPAPAVTYVSPAASGSLTFTPAPNAHGTATLTVSVSDGEDTISRSFDVVVNSVNDAPSFTLLASGSLSRSASAGATMMELFATNISGGPNETTQMVGFNVSSTNSSLFAVQPAVDQNGTLTFTPDAGLAGVAILTVTAQDDGGTANGGVDTSVPRQFILTILSTNADLAGLSLSAGVLSPAFASTTTAYECTVPHGTASLTVTPTSKNADATVRVNNGLVASGSASAGLPLQVGLNTITILVTAQDGTTTRTYTVAVTRQSVTEHALENWAAEKGLPPSAAGPMADADGDGVPNLMEFAFGTSPSASSAAPMQFSGTFAGGVTLTQPGQPVAAHEPKADGTDFRAVFVRRADHEAVGLTYTVKFSPDLVNWQTSTATPTVLGTDGTHEAVSVPYPLFIGGKKARFFTVGVGTAP